MEETEPKEQEKAPSEHDEAELQEIEEFEEVEVDEEVNEIEEQIEADMQLLEEDYEYYFDVETEAIGGGDSRGEQTALSYADEPLLTWRTMVLLVFNDQWGILILATSILYSFFLIYCSTYSSYLTYYDIFLPVAFDVLYAVDVFLLMVYKSWSQLNRLCVHAVRSDWKVTLDAISIIPFDAIFFLNNGLKFEKGAELTFFRINRCLRFIRIRDYFYMLHNTVSHINVPMHLIEWLVHFLLLGQISAAILYSMRCFDREECWPVRFITTNYTNFQWYLITMYAVTGQITSRAFPDILVVVNEEALLMLLTNIVSFFLIMGYILGYLTSAFIHQQRDIFVFTSEKRIAKLYLNFHKINEALVERVMHFSDEFWKKRFGVKIFDLASLLPTVGIREVCLDIYWAAFKHSHVFRNMDVSFLAVVATHMRYDFCLPGDVIFRQNELKSKMIYIVSGVIQVISEVDGETPIISFSTGTLLGESTLFFSYMNKTDVICSTFCEIMVLERRPFHDILSYYPFQRWYFYRNMKERYWRARFQKSLATSVANISLKKQNEMELHMTSLFWIKSIMKVLTSGKNSANLNEDKLVRQVQFTPRNLDLLVISKELELVTDPICLKSTFPYIFQPNSQLLKLWNFIVLIVVIIASILLPYYAFLSCRPFKHKDISTVGESCKNADKAVIIQVITVFVYVADLIIQVSTAVRTKDGLVADWRHILVHRMTELKFTLDILATIPFEIGVVLMGGVKELYVVSSTLSLNRLLKLWKLEMMFVELENSLHMNITFIRIFKYSIYLIFSIYYGAALLYGIPCYRGDCEFNCWLKFEILNTMTDQTGASVILFDVTNDLFDEHIPLSLLFSTIIITGKTFPRDQIANMYDIVILVMIVTVASFMMIYMIAGLSATKILQDRIRINFQDSVYGFRKLLKSFKMPANIQQHLLTVLETKWMYLNSILTLQIEEIFHFTNKSVMSDVQIDICFRALTHVPLFQEVNSEFVKSVAAESKILVTPSRMTVLYTGEVAKEMYVILHGYCEVMSNLTGKRQKVLGPNEHFGAIELFLDIPCATTVRTITNCRLASIKESHLRRAIVKYPLVHMDLKRVVATFANMQQVSNFRSKQFAFDSLVSSTTMVKTRSLHFFELETRKSQYDEPFKKAGVAGLVRYFLLPFTIMPDGNFIKWWEAFRFIFALITCIWYPARVIVLGVNAASIFYVDKFLDLTAVIDQYVRLHVCYYNEDGILVTHPMRTALYYLKHGFLLDFLGWLPIEILFVLTNVKGYSHYPLVRVIQIHRILSTFYYLEANILEKHQVLTIAKYFPIVFIIVNLAASCICTNVCIFDENIWENASHIYGAGVSCSNNSWLHLSEFANPHRAGKLTPVRVYLYGLYWMTSTITHCSFRGVICKTESECIIYICLAVVGFVGYLYVLSSIIASRASHNVDLTSYQEKMHSLVAFMSNNKIHSDLRSDVIRYFEQKWARNEGKDVLVMLKVFHFTLREDLLLSVFGKTLKQCAVLSTAGTSFFRVLLEKMKFRFYMKHGIVINTNDIQDEMYILHKGRIDVIGPDGTRILTLQKGAIFGNFEMGCATRQTLFMQARSHIEILTIKTQLLYDILNNYPHIKVKFKKAIRLNRDFLVPVTEKDKDEDEVPSQQSSSLHTTSKSSLGSFVVGIRNKVCDQYSIYYRTWELSVLIAGAFVTYILTLYQVALVEFHISIIVVYYILDATYLFKIYLKFHLSYEDEYGDTINDLGKIANRYMKDYFGLYLDIFTLIPFEVFAFAAGTFRTPKFLIAYGFLRFNRLPRIIFVIKNFQAHAHRLNINVLRRRFAFIMLIVVLLMHTVTCFLITLKKWTLGAWHPSSWTSKLRLIEFMQMMRISVSLFVGNGFSQKLAIYNGMIVYFVLVALVSQIVNAFIIGEMCSALEIVGYHKIHYANKIANLKAYLRLLDLSNSIVLQVWEYLLYLWNVCRGTQVPLLLKEAPPSLVEGIKTSLYGHHIYTNYIFSTCQTDFLRQVINTLKQYTFFPQNCIEFQGDINDCMYFIYSGEVEVLKDTEDYYKPTRVDILKEGDVFGMIQGLYPLRMHKYSYRAYTLAVVLILHRLDWQHLLDYFPNARHEIYERATSLQFTI